MYSDVCTYIYIYIERERDRSILTVYIYVYNVRLNRNRFGEFSQMASLSLPLSFKDNYTRQLYGLYPTC